MSAPVPPRRRATIFDVASEANVSRGTVSRVLNDEPYVSSVARTSVEAAIRKVGYVRNSAARSLKTQRSHVIALIVHEPHALFIQDPNIGQILLGTNEGLSKADYQMVCLIIDSDRDVARVRDYLQGGSVDGVVMVSVRENDPIARTVRELALPAVVVGHPSDLGGIPYIGIDNRAAARSITERLVATGRSHIAIIAAALDRDSGTDRLAGFTDALGDRFDPDLVSVRPYYSWDDGIAGMTELLEKNPLIDGVFASSDALAAGAVEVLRQAGRRIPEDVGVVGFDDSQWALRTTPNLSTIRQPADLLGRRAAEVVVALVDGRDIEVSDDNGVILPTSITWRDSA